MDKDILVILMMAFGLFAILMFILFYIYAKKYYNNKKLIDDYHEDNNDDDEIELVNILADNVTYILDANGYQLKKGQNVKFILDDKSIDGKVIKENYQEERSNIELPLKSLLLDDNKEEEEVNLKDSIDSNEKLTEDKKELLNDNLDEFDFIPKKK